MWLQLAPRIILILLAGTLPLVAVALFGRYGPPAAQAIRVGGWTGVSKTLKWLEATHLVPRFGKHRAMRVTAVINAALHSLAMPLLPVVLIPLDRAPAAAIVAGCWLVWSIYLCGVAWSELRGRKQRRLQQRRARHGAIRQTPAAPSR